MRIDDREPVILADGLRKVYGDAVAVDDVSFEVMPGDIFGILGHNGAGKTTTVECLQGLRRADGGTLRVLGHDPKERRHLAAFVGSQLQDAALPDRLRVEEALRLFAGPQSVDVDELMRSWGLSAHRRSAFGELSGGLRQRVFIALALLNRPRVVFLDELTQGLDPLARREVWQVIKSVRDQGTTVVLVTHFMDEAEELCDRVAVFDRGRVVASGTPNEIICTHATTSHITYTEHASPAPSVDWASVDGVVGVENIDGRTRVSCSADSVTHACAALAHVGAQPHDLRISQPTLEDAVLAIEGATK